MELLMLYHVFSLKEPVFFELFCTKFLSAKLTSSVCCLNFGDTLWKKTFKPNIKVKIFDSREDIEGISKACLTFLKSSKPSWLPRKLVAKKYYWDLQLLSILTYCWKGTSYNSILTIIDWLTKIIYDKPLPINCYTQTCKSFYRPCTLIPRPPRLDR